MINFNYTQPETIREASDSLRSAKAAQLNSGGTDLLDLLKEEILTPEIVVNLKSVEEPELRRIEERGGELHIGALVTLQEIADSGLIRERYTALAEAASEAASPQLRNVGTLGGNLCQRPRCWYYRNAEFPCIRKGGDICYAVGGENRYHCVVGGDPCYIVHPSDPAVALVALEGRVLVQNRKKVREIPVAEFFILPEADPTRETVLEKGDVVIGVVVPTPAAGTKSGYTKFKVRKTWDFAVVSVAAVVGVESGVLSGGRIALGGVAPVPWLEETVTRGVAGTPLNSDAVQALADRALPDALTMEQNEYKLPLARNLIADLLLRLGGVS